MFTNKSNISLMMAVWLASDDYDLEFDPNTYSVTTLLKPVRSVILSRRLRLQEKQDVKDIADIIPSRLGSAVHTAVEVAWLDHRVKAMKKLGIPDDFIDKIKLNADNEDDPDAIYIYIEQRSKMEILPGIFLSGKFDTVESGRVKDVKTTKTYSWIKGSNNKRYMMQGSMYRLLNPEIIHDNYMDVEYLFTDFNPYEAARNREYPPRRVMTKSLKLLPVSDTKDFVIDQITLLEKYKDVPQEDLPKCTPDELWQDPAKWAYFSNPTNKKATKLYDSAQEAAARNAQDGSKGKIEKRPAEPTFCKYCDALSACTQAENFIAEGLLKL